MPSFAEYYWAGRRGHLIGVGGVSMLSLLHIYLGRIFQKKPKRGPPARALTSCKKIECSQGKIP